MTAPNGFRSTGEVVLQVGAEGGSLTLSGKRAENGHWRFRLDRNENTLRDILWDDDQSTIAHEFADVQYADSLDEALKLLDRYPWFRLLPLQVHPHFMDAILDNVRTRGGDHEENRWRDRIGHSNRLEDREALKARAYGFLHADCACKSSLFRSTYVRLCIIPGLQMTSA